MSITTSISTEIAKNKALEFAEKMLAKASNPSAKFIAKNSSKVCPSCLGSGVRTIYHNGRPYAKRCESAQWDSQKKRFICLGNPYWQELELANRKDLTNQIWKIVMSLKQKKSFLFWLKQEYKTISLSTLSIQQLELIVNQVKSHSLFVSLRQVA